MTSSADYEGVVLLGFPRSGTTLLRRLLDGHPALCAPPETHLFRACAHFLRGEEAAGDLAVGVVGALAFSGIGEAEVLGRVREMAFGFLREIRDRSGKRRWVEKTAYDAFHLDTIERLCAGRCRFVCLSRHALDAVCSLRELVARIDLYPDELAPYIRRHASPLLAFAHAWADCGARMARLLAERPDEALHVRYEDLVTEPERTLARVLDFLGEPADAAALVGAVVASPGRIGYGDWKTYGRSEIDGSGLGRWKSELLEDRVRLLAPIVNPALAALGYDAVVAPTARSAADSRRRFELDQAITHLKTQAPRERPKA